jgi:hypothetical protein
MNAQQAFENGFAPFSLVTFDGTNCTAGFYYDHSGNNGSIVISAGMRYHRADGRIGVAF